MNWGWKWAIAKASTRLIELLAMTCTYCSASPLLRLFLTLMRWRRDCLSGPQGRASEVIAVVTIWKKRMKALRTKEETAKRHFLALPICSRNTQFIFKICRGSVMDVSSESSFLSIRIHKLSACEGELQMESPAKIPSAVLVLSKRVISCTSEGTLTLTIQQGPHKEIIRIHCLGQSWHSILRGCALLAQMKPLQLEDVEEVLECFPSLEDSL